MFVDNTIPELTMGQKLKMFREINNLSQEQLGQKLNVTDKTISAWETGEREINLTNAKTICELFNIPNSYFVFNENFKSINDKLQNQIRDYIKDMEFRNKVEKVINICKQKINEDAMVMWNILTDVALISLEYSGKKKEIADWLEKFYIKRRRKDKDVERGVSRRVNFLEVKEEEYKRIAKAVSILTEQDSANEAFLA